MEKKTEDVLFATGHQKEGCKRRQMWNDTQVANKKKAAANAGGWNTIGRLLLLTRGMPRVG